MRQILCLLFIRHSSFSPLGHVHNRAESPMLATSPGTGWQTNTLELRNHGRSAYQSLIPPQVVVVSSFTSVYLATPHLRLVLADCKKCARDTLLTSRSPLLTITARSAHVLFACWQRSRHCRHMGGHEPACCSLRHHVYVSCDFS